MSTTKTQIAHYFQKTLAADVEPEIWQPGRRLPVFLRDGYTFYEIGLFGDCCLLMVDKDPPRSATTIRKHIEQVQLKWNSNTIIYVREKTTADERRRLIEQKIPFIVPGNQMYLPMLGIDLREHFRRLREEVTKFSPATQAAILLLLTTPEPRAYDARELAGRLGYSKMTASRILNELKTEDLGITRLEGRTRLMEFNGDRHALWERVLPLLSSPVKNRQHITSGASGNWGTRAGLTALAAHSMLAGPTIPTMAVTSEQWKKMEKQPDVTLAKPTDPNSLEIEVWRYDPTLFAADGTCDRYSLFLSLKDNKDERVESAIQEMMEALK